MNILYIGKTYREKSGGSLVAERNLYALQQNHKVFTVMLSLDNNKKKLKNIICNKPLGYERKIMQQIKRQITQNNIALIFIDTSVMGGFAKLLKRYKLPIAVFFQNVEQLYFNDKIKIDGKVNAIMKYAARENEKKAVKYADYLITLTQRDSENLQKLYGRKADMVSPMTVADTYKKEAQKIELDTYHLFIGSAFFANKQGIEWYIENVLQYINNKLIIIGKGMGYLSEKYPQANLKNVGFVEDLASYYNNADFVINPVFLGSGMKTKTIEALMYGKTIFGTDEAFIGVDRQAINCIKLCNTADDFINAINNYNGKKFNQEARDLYLTEYTTNKTIKDFNQLINKQ